MRLEDFKAHLRTITGEYPINIFYPDRSFFPNNLLDLANHLGFAIISAGFSRQTSRGSDIPRLRL